jgi:hypothetical protein
MNPSIAISPYVPVVMTTTPIAVCPCFFELIVVDGLVEIKVGKGDD